MNGVVRRWATSERVVSSEEWVEPNGKKAKEQITKTEFEILRIVDQKLERIVVGIYVKPTSSFRENAIHSVQVRSDDHFFSLKTGDRCGCSGFWLHSLCAE